MGRVAILLLVVALLIPLSGCLMQEKDDEGFERDSNALPAPERLPVSQGDRFNLSLKGTTWGHLELEAVEDLRIQINITNDRIEDLSLFSQDGKGIYNEKNYTLIFAYTDGELSEKYGETLHPTMFGEIFYFSWWGTPRWPIWPDTSTDWNDVDYIDLKEGESGTLLVANTVPGYNIALDAESYGKGPVQEFDWHLGVNENHHLLLPQKDEKYVWDHGLIRINKESSWLENRDQIPPSLVVTRSWTYREGITLRGGIAQDSLASTPQGECADEIPDVPTGRSFPGPLPSWDIIMGGHYYTAYTNHRFIGETCDYEFKRYRNETDVGVENVEHGAAFMTVPLRP